MVKGLAEVYNSYSLNVSSPLIQSLSLSRTVFNVIASAWNLIVGTIIALCVVAQPSFSQATQVPPLRFAGIAGSANTEISEQVIREAYKRVGQDIEILKMPPSRALAMANSGDLDGELYRVAGLERRFENLVQVPVPVNYLEAVVITGEAIHHPVSWQDLMGKQFAIRRGTKFAEMRTAGMDPVYAVHNSQLIDMLARGRVEMILIARLNGMALLQEQQCQFRILVPPIERFPLFHYLHKKHVALVAPVMEALAKMKSEGLIAKVRQSYVDRMSVCSPH